MDIIQLKVALNGTAPPVWRRILVEKDLTFEELHQVIQYAMGWDNQHLYSFNFDGARLSSSRESEGTGFEDAARVRLGAVLKNVDQKFIYLYDFGDSWTHLVTVEKFLLRDKKVIYPVCIEGKMNCPPEDCGGVPGYANLLEILSDKENPEREEIIDWLGGNFDPTEFNKEYTNRLLSNLSSD